MRLKYKIAFLVFIPLLILTLYTYNIYNYTISSIDEKGHRISITSKDTFYAANIRYLSTKIAELNEHLILDASRGDKEGAEEAIREIQRLIMLRNENFEDLKRNEAWIAEEEEMQEVFRIGALIENISNANEEFISQANTANIATMIQLREKNIHPLENELEEEVTDFIEFHIKEFEEHVKMVKESETAGLRGLLIVSAISLIIYVLVIAMLNLAIARPIKKLTEDVERITKGDFNVSLEESNVDEMQKLVYSLNRILASMKLAILRTGMTKREFGIGEVAIKAKEHAERKMVESEERLKGLIESVGGWVWEIDEEGRYTYASSRVKDMLGYEPEEIIGKTSFDLMPQDEAKRFKKEFERMQKARKPFAGLENKYMRKDGRMATLETSGVPVFSDSKFLGYRGVDRDITARKKYGEQAGEYKALFESISDGIIVMDTKTKKIIDANQKAAEILGYKEEELEKMRVKDIHPKKFLTHVLSEFSALAKGKKEESKRIPCLCKDGKTIHCDIKASRILMGGKKPALIGFFREVKK